MFHEGCFRSSLRFLRSTFSQFSRVRRTLKTEGFCRRGIPHAERSNGEDHWYHWYAVIFREITGIPRTTITDVQSGAKSSPRGFLFFFFFSFPIPTEIKHGTAVCFLHTFGTDRLGNAIPDVDLSPPVARLQGRTKSEDRKRRARGKSGRYHRRRRDSIQRFDRNGKIGLITDSGITNCSICSRRGRGTGSPGI